MIKQHQWSKPSNTVFLRWKRVGLRGLRAVKCCQKCLISTDLGRILLFYGACKEVGTRKHLQLQTATVYDSLWQYMCMLHHPARMGGVCILKWHFGARKHWYCKILSCLRELERLYHLNTYCSNSSFKTKEFVMLHPILQRNAADSVW